MAYPFLPMTDEVLEKVTRRMQDSILTAKFSGPRVVLAIPQTRSIEELNSQTSETTQPQLPH